MSSSSDRVICEITLSVSKFIILAGDSTYVYTISNQRYDNWETNE